MKPKAFALDNPIINHGQCLIPLVIDQRYHEFVRAMPCTLRVDDFMSMPNLLHLHIDPRYDFEEAWLWIYEQLEAETNKVELGDVWGKAIENIE